MTNVSLQPNHDIKWLVTGILGPWFFFTLFTVKSTTRLWKREFCFHCIHLKQLITIHSNQTSTRLFRSSSHCLSMCVPVLVGRAGGIEPCTHQWERQVEVLQVEGKGLPHSPVCLCTTPPLTLDLHGDWTMTCRQDPQSIPLAQVCKTSSIYLRQAERGREGK